MEIQNTVAIVVKKDNLFLLIRKAKHKHDAGDWCFPGGHVDRGENFFEAAQREAKEEINGVEIIEKQPFLIIMHQPPKVKPPHKHKCHAFRGKMVSNLKAGDDADNFKWVSKDDILGDPRVQNWTKRVLNFLESNL